MRDLMAKCLDKNMPIWKQVKGMELMINFAADWLEMNGIALHDLHTWIEAEERVRIARQN